MRKRILVFIPLVVFVVLVGFFLRALFSDPTLLTSARIGKPLPALTLPSTLDPSQEVTNADLPSGPLLVNVWATWCPTCYAEHQYLNTLAAKGVPIIGLNYKDDPSKARRWLAELGNPYRLVVSDDSGRYGIELGVYGAPETYVLNAAHQIVYRHVGDVTDEVWQQTLSPLWQSLHRPANEEGTP